MISFVASTTDISPVLFALGLLYPAAAMIGYIVREKELRQKELMKIMSVTESDIGWAWFMTFSLFHFLSATVTAYFSTILFSSSSFFVLWVFWQFTFIAIIVFCMAISALTSKSTRAVLIGVLVFLSGALLTVLIDFNTTNPLVVALIRLHPVTTFTSGLKTAGRLEDLSLGITKDTLYFTESYTEYSFATTLQWLGIDAFVWGFLSYYLNRVVPQDYGLNLPLWFFLMPSYWIASWRHSYHGHSVEIESANTLAVVEPVEATLKKQAELGQSIEIENLRKTYGEKIAIDSLSLSIYSGQITALLGHNGTCFQ